MSTLDITTTRYALVDDQPVVEQVTFRYAPEDARSRPQPFHDQLGLTIPVEDPTTGEVGDQPAPNLWFCTSFSLPNGEALFIIPEGTPHPGGGTSYPDDSDYWDPYILPIRKGVTIITQREYEAAITARDAQIESDRRQAVSDWYASKQAAWDAKAARYAKLGWDEDDVIAEFGARPVG